VVAARRAATTTDSASKHLDTRAHAATESTVLDPYIRASATKLGITPEEYAEHVARGEKWCSYHQSWHPRGVFGLDASTASGLAGRCLEADAAMKRARAAERRRSKSFRGWIGHRDETGMRTR
jgi:hypothetical protein